MQDTDRISGTRLFKVFDQLQKDRTILKLNILKTGYEGLTIVVGVDTSNGIPYFLVDTPGGSREIIRETGGGRAFFEYSGEDKLQYNFRSVIDKVIGDDIRLKFPEVIKRIQRRRHFRVAPPLGTKMVLNIDNKRYAFNVINFSQGGALINQDSQLHKKSIFYVGAYLRGIDLICKEDFASAEIGIKKAEIKRMEKNSATGKYQYAIQFQAIERKKEAELRIFTYNCQREVLKRRSFLSENS
ncbi:MAG: PilZ domain-containing protein [Deltaproteobacteria bacterium]|nr:PilZ domain-containing protein [Deltaproteobacteria bacterium]